MFLLEFIVSWTILEICRLYCYENANNCTTFFCSTINFFALIFFSVFWMKLKKWCIEMKSDIRMYTWNWLECASKSNGSLALPHYRYLQSIHSNELHGFKLFPKHWQQSPNQIHLLKQSRVLETRIEVYSQRPNNQSVNIHFRWIWFVIKPFLSLALETHSYCLCN